MLVTDGVPYNYKELFEKYNWKYDTPVRVFTYLIGREVKVVPLQVLLCVVVIVRPAKCLPYRTFHQYTLNVVLF